MTGFVEGAERFASAAWWFIGERSSAGGKAGEGRPMALAVAVLPVLADVAVGILAARHARRGGEGRDV